MISVKKKQKIELTKEQGWYSVSELDELGWSKQGTQFTIWTNYHDVCSLSFPSSKVWNPNLQILLGPRSMAPKPNAKLWERPTSGKDCGVCLWFPTCLSYIYIYIIHIYIIHIYIYIYIIYIYTLNVCQGLHCLGSSLGLPMEGSMNMTAKKSFGWRSRKQEKRSSLQPTLKCTRSSLRPSHIRI